MVSAIEAAPLRPRFADPSVVKQGWYLLAPSRKVRADRVRIVEAGPRRVALYRDLGGRAHATGDRCPHLGSDLALAKVTTEGLRCAFHGWCWGPDGACTAAPGNEPLPARRLKQFATTERDGFVWAWLGGEPAFALPEIPATLRHRRVLLPQRLHAHADVIFSNLFDGAHFGPSHGIDAATVTVEEQPPYRIAHQIAGTLPQRPALSWIGLARKPIEATFTQHGGGLVHVHVRRPIEFVIVFTIRHDRERAARTRTMLFLRRRRDLPRALSILWATTLDDMPLMESIEWTGAFAASDAVLERYQRFVEAMPTW